MRKPGALITIFAAVTMLFLIETQTKAQGLPAAASIRASVPAPSASPAPSPAASPAPSTSPSAAPNDKSSASEAKPGAASSNSDDELRKRVAELEAEMAVMKAEIERLKQPPSQPSAVVANASATTAAAQPSGAAATPGATNGSSAEPATAKAVSQDEHKPGFQVGSVRVIPYGALYLNLFGNTRGVNSTDVPLFATTASPGNVSGTARQSRVGLRFEGPGLAGAKSSGVVEFDFFGGFPSIGIGEDFGIMRLRLAYFKLDWKNTSLETGQDWTIFSPLNPVSLASYGTPEFAASGNLFARIPQIKLEQRWMDGAISLAGAVLAPRSADYPPPGTNPLVLQPGTASLSLRPAFEARFGLNGKNWLGSKKTASVGLSAHYGWARVATSPHNIDVDVMGLSGDWSIPFGPRVSLAGEAFFGRNLAAFQGDVFQTFVSDFAYRIGGVLVPGGPRSPGTRGGWSQLGFTPPGFNDKLSLYGGFGIEDPRDHDFLTLTPHDFRLRNLDYAFTGIYKLTPQISWSFEYRRLQTLYLMSGHLNNNHFNLAATYNF